MARKEIIVNGASYALSYEILNPSQSNAILILHGWGSTKEIMKQAFGRTLPQYKHIYLDLPGFGASSIHHVLDTQQYANIVSLFLVALNITPSIIMGHSFGGKVATLLCPEKLILLSSAGIVYPKTLKLKSKIALFKLLKPFLPQRYYRFFASKDVAGMNPIMYEILKKVVNENFALKFSACQSKTAIFWGKDDTATPLKSGEAIHSLIKNSSFYSLQGDHFFFVRQGKEIENILLESHF